MKELIKNEVDKQLLMTSIVELNKYPYEVTVKELRKPRSLNKALWVINAQLAEYLNEKFKNTFRDLLDSCKATEFDSKLAHNLISGALRPPRLFQVGNTLFYHQFETSSVDKEEMLSYLKDLIDWAFKIGCQLDVPEYIEEMLNGKSEGCLS